MEWIRSRSDLHCLLFGPPDLRAHHRIACAISDAIGINQDGACACRALVALFRTASVPQAEIWLNPMSSMTRGHFLSFPSPAPSHVPHFEFPGTASGDRLRLALSVGCLVECMTSVMSNAGDDDEFEMSSGIGRCFWHYAIMRLDCPHVPKEILLLFLRRRLLILFQ
ncbi:uncharacterized protein K489DRAFT_181063 [Dissoconium aciculare CBS 342.82]|uniref:Uncharacterized protein n=1 Tax=Dissoconium aciculare CBS 342.82 TaxID=1314786 RepID=A0A6J3M907_9PEZI|nr:uncharacterized protein K489DRAFT_181063 [Dissoconium aciculare CBS 342.82]KAF1824368.1 hypothetical protein K489DRAFT_181063 [Dissoconium aciculare CBS 342.82]